MVKCTRSIGVARRRCKKARGGKRGLKRCMKRAMCGPKRKKRRRRRR